ncbi:MAG: hypothetical protein P8Z73_09995 [Desulfobacteraceae bacterium]
MNHNIAKIGIVFVFAALFIVTVSSAQAGESIWFSGNEGYRPAVNYLNSGLCYSAPHNSENIYLAAANDLRQEANAGTCSLTAVRTDNIWFQTHTP